MLRVLLVEGHASFRKILQQGLTNVGSKIKLQTAKNPQEMEFMLRHETMDVVILSMTLPAEDSFRALEFILRCKEQQAGFPYVIALSPDYHPQKRNMTIACGADDVIFTPVSIEEILKRIERFDDALQFCDNGMIIPLSQSIKAAQG